MLLVLKVDKMSKLRDVVFVYRDLFDNIDDYRVLRIVPESSELACCVITASHCDLLRPARAKLT